MNDLIREAIEIVRNIQTSEFPDSEKQELIRQVLYDVALQAEIITEPIQEQP